MFRGRESRFPIIQGNTTGVNIVKACRSQHYVQRPNAVRVERGEDDEGTPQGSSGEPSVNVFQDGRRQAEPDAQARRLPQDAIR